MKSSSIYLLAILTTTLVFVFAGLFANHDGKRMSDRRAFQINAVGSTDDTPVSPIEEGIKDFPVYDSLAYRNEPDLTKFGFKPIELLIPSKLWRPKTDRSEPDLRTVRWRARRLRKDVPVCINIEHWDLRGDEDTVNANIKKYVSIIEAIREENPELKIGIYRFLPIRSYWSAVENEDSEKYQKWQKDNIRLRELAEHVDVIYPSLYEFYENPDRWERFAVATIREARQYNKPVVPFLWPQFHQGGQFKEGPRPYIPAKHWKQILEVCYANADGVVIWGGWDEKALLWNDDMPWWRETQAFLERIQKTPQPSIDP